MVGDKAVTVFEGIAELRGAVGRHLGWSPWTTVTDGQVRAFVEATTASVTVAQPTALDTVPDLLTLALTNLFLPQVVEVRGVSLGVNRGTGTVRFPAPAPVGTRLRAGVELTAVHDVAGGVDTTMVITVEGDGRDEPACVVHSLSRYLQ